MALKYNFQAESVIDEGRTTQDNIDEIRHWLDKEVKTNASLSTLIPTKLNNEFIVLFLLSCNNIVQFTKDTIIAYFRCKSEAPEIFNERDIDSEDLKLAISTIRASSIPVRTDDNDVIHFFKLEDGNYNNFHLIPIMKLSYMLLDISQQTNPPNGLIVVIDVKQLGLMHLTRLKLNAIKKYFQFLQEGFPIKMKVIHIINTVYFFDKVMNIIKVFMKNDLISLLKVHPPNMTINELHEIIPKQCLPKEYGGDLANLEELNNATIEQFRKLKQFFQNEEEMRTKCVMEI